MFYCMFYFTCDRSFTVFSSNAGFRILQSGRTMAIEHGARAYIMGVWGRSPEWGPEAEPPKMKAFVHFTRDAMHNAVVARATSLFVRPSVRHTPVLYQNEES